MKQNKMPCHSCGRCGMVEDRWEVTDIVCLSTALELLNSHGHSLFDSESQISL